MDLQPYTPLSGTSSSASSPSNMSLESAGTTLAPFLTELEFDRLAISPETVQQFMELESETLLKFDCINIVAPASLRSRVAFGNHLENITFDLTNLPDGSFYKVAPQVGWLIATSSCARQLIVKDKLNRSSNRRNITPFDFREVQRCLGFRPKAKAMSDGMYWIWKRDTVDKLSWTW